MLDGKKFIDGRSEIPGKTEKDRCRDQEGMLGEKREEARIKEAKSPKATDNTYGVRV